MCHISFTILTRHRFTAIGTRHIEKLVSNGADAHAKTAWGDTAIHYAAHSGTTEVLNYLLKEGVTTEKGGEEGEAAESLKVRFGMSDVRFEKK